MTRDKMSWHGFVLNEMLTVAQVAHMLILRHPVPHQTYQPIRPVVGYLDCSRP